MEDKTKKLVLVLEAVALTVALVLILIDYKLKKDLIELFTRIEKTLGQKPSRPDIDTTSNPSRVRASGLVDGNSPMEARIHPDVAESNGKAKPAASRRTAAKRNGGNGDTPVPEHRDTVGP